ncbi:DUF4839 domain-containing protein [Nocardioides panzhihuensis]|uniref:DUF4839 domain-containing protein n=1 Tax=Nocardioides panzhihuensis TaxID=860243 RepID=A0A7Z0DKA8_9ACTN|nr:DUF4839 domain-containing protein [Nocardioides panzhihuensis]NYI76980.1 hypothetical protein [Nocardioides panzhihuensis]
MREHASRDESPQRPTGDQGRKEIRYDFMTVNTIRGAENRAAVKWTSQGWELVGQDSGTLRTQLTFRREKKPMNRLVLVGGISAVMILIVAVVLGTISEGNDPAATSAEPSETAGVEESAQTERATHSESSQPSGDGSGGGEEGDTPASRKVLTVKNSPELAQALAVSDYCDATVADFASKYADVPIAFNGSISEMTQHQGATTRYDILVAPGDAGASSTVGPAIQLRDVGVIDLNLVGPNVPPTVGVGDMFRFKATVGKFDPDSCLLTLYPVETRSR